MHPKIIFKLRKILYKLAEDSCYQVICASHSPMMIDISKPHSSIVRVIKTPNDETRTYQVGETVFQKDEDMKNFVSMINKFNPHVCESFFANEVVLVEGDTETIVFRDLIERFYPEKEIYILNTGSKNNITFFQEIFTHFRIKHFIIHDSDKPKNKKGNVNSAWTLNENISNKLVDSNTIEDGIAKRFIHVPDFEGAHNLKMKKTEKPLQAYIFAEAITSIDQDLDCLKWLKEIVEGGNTNHDQEFILSHDYYKTVE